MEYELATAKWKEYQSREKVQLIWFVGVITTGGFIAYTCILPSMISAVGMLISFLCFALWLDAKSRSARANFERDEPEMAKIAF